MARGNELEEEHVHTAAAAASQFPSRSGSGQEGQREDEKWKAGRYKKLPPRKTPAAQPAPMGLRGTVWYYSTYVVH